MMGFSVFEDLHAAQHGVERWAGYGVPALCDHPDCSTEIWRGEACKCGDLFTDNHGRHVDGECMGCGFFYCNTHRFGNHEGITPKPDTPQWVRWILEDDSWARWREEHPTKAAALRSDLDETPPPETGTPEWARWILTDATWSLWRQEHRDNLPNIQALTK